MIPYRFARKWAALAGALWLAQVFAVAQIANADNYIESYVAKGADGLTMRLRLLKPLSEVPASGWLNSAEGAQANGEFAGRVDRPMKMVSKSAPVVMEAEKRGAISAARYHIDSGTLTVCMLSLADGAYRNVTEMSVPENYTLCAQMKREDR